MAEKKPTRDQVRNLIIALCKEASGKSTVKEPYVLGDSIRENGEIVTTGLGMDKDTRKGLGANVNARIKDKRKELKKKKERRFQFSSFGKKNTVKSIIDKTHEKIHENDN